MCFYGYFFFKDWHPVVKDKWQKLIAWIKIHLFSSPFFWLVLGWYCKCKSYICIYGEAGIFIHGVYYISYFLIRMKWSRVKSLSRVQLFVTPWTVAYQAPPFMGFSRQEYWSGLSFPSPRSEVKWSESRSVMSSSLRPNGLYSPWNSPGQNTGVGSLSLLQEIFPNQGSNPGLPHCGQMLYQLSHKGSLAINKCWRVVLKE